MLVIGLTGGAGSGKSTVAELFAKLGTAIIDTDVIAHDLSRPPSAALNEVRARFGARYMASDGSMDRRRMRELVLADPAARAQLEAIFHPKILEAAKAQLAALPASQPYALLVVPLLFESGRFLPLLARTITVDCTVAQQRERLRQRPGLSAENVDQLLAAQCSREQRLMLANDVIRNDSSMDELARQVTALHSGLLQLRAASETTH